MATGGSAGAWYRVSLDEVAAASGTYDRLNGDYFLTIPGVPKGTQRWEVNFPAVAGYDRLRLEIGPGSKPGTQRAKVYFSGSEPSPVWSQDHITGDPGALRLTLEPGTGPAGVRWPSVLTAEKLVAQATPALRDYPASAVAFALGSSSGAPPSPYPPQCPPCDCPMGCPCPPQTPPCCSSTGSTGQPVKYFNGELQIAETDVSTAGFGRVWGHTRTYSNQLASTFNFGNGYNWVIVQWPYLSLASPTVIAAVQGANWTVWFDEQTGGSFVARYGAKQTLIHTGSTYQLALTTGEILEFNDFIQTSFPPGSFKNLTIAGGDTIQAISYDGSQIAEIQRRLVQNGETITESFLYAYIDSGSNAGNLASVTLRRNSDGGPWSNVSQAVYTYYGPNDPNGSLGDLCTATQQVPAGTGWANTATNYFRYYTGTQAHLIKYSVGPSGYATLADQGNPLLASDAQVAQVATQYLQYDNLNRVTLESVAGGTLTTTFQYVDSGYTANTDYNAWTRKTTETRPDGSQNVVYTNYIGQVLLKDLQSGGNHWTEFRQYDSDAREISQALPSAVISYSEGTPAGTLNVNLPASTGLFNLVQYYPDSDPAAGYVQSKSIQHGTAGTPVVLTEFTYTGQTVGIATVQMLASQTVYSNDDGTGAITTSYSYAWYSGTLQVQQKTTTLPIVPLAQNGFNTADTQQEYYDTLGQMTWEQGPRGFIDNFTFDSVTGGTVQMIEDVDPSQESPPSGWSRPSGLPAPLNLVTDYELDNRGRTIQALGPSQLIDGVSVRTADWTVFDDVDFTTTTARGFATGLAPNYAYNSLGPASIAITNASGQPTDTIQAAESSLSGRLSGTNTFPQSTWTRWTKNRYDNGGRLIATRAYYAIPAIGDGTAVSNYNETDYGYDAMDRPSRLLSPGGTINRKVYDARNNLLGTYVGTNDYGATDTDPTGGGAPGNNMVQVTGQVYDNGSPGGDGNLTQLTQFVDATGTNDVVTTYTYDWRDRQVTAAGALNFFQEAAYDNLNHITEIDSYNGSGGNLIARSQTLWDNRGRVYQSIVYGVDPDTGTVGNPLVTNNWYDQAGNQIKTLPAGSQCFTKSFYDSQARVYAECQGYYTGSGSELFADVPLITSQNAIFEQTLSSFAADQRQDSPIEVDSYQRFDSATGTGALNPPYSGAQPLARVSYVGNYYDGIGRKTASADYGTNGNAAFARPGTPPASSASVLVTAYAYDGAGNLFQTTDPSGSIVQQTFDLLGQVLTSISNYTGGCPGNSTDVTVQFGYNSDGNLVSLTAINPTTGNQVTTYQYGTTLADSAIASNLLLSATVYPDAVDSNDRVTQTYNRQGQVAGMTDQNGNVHQYLFDLLGRPTDDIITTLGTGVDGTVQRLSQAYNDIGLVYQATSYADSAGTTVVNQLQNEYNSFQQLATQYQEHSGAVNISTSAQVDYSYADGSTNTVRLTGLAYPNGRVISYGYGSSGGDSDQLSRIASYLDVASGITLVNYTYLGLATFVQTNAPQPSLTWTLIGGSDPTNPYAGLDQFGRTINCLWTSGSGTVAQILYGYNQASRRIWRQDPVASSQSPPVYQDELYSYDGLQRLVDMGRGQLTNGNTQIANLALAQQWNLDATGNWSNFLNTDTQTPTNSLDQQRTSNPVNEIAAISQRYGLAWAQPAYDRAGNTKAIPQPASPASAFAGTYDAWNRLVSLTGVATYLYDALNRRVSKTTPGIILNYYYSAQWQVIEEHVSTAEGRAVKKPLTRRSLVASGAAERQFVWGLRYIDDLVCRDRAPSGTGPLSERLYPLQDANWNTIAIVSTSGTVQERYRYSAYGMPTFMNSSFMPIALDGSYQWETLYAAYRWNRESGIYFVRRRDLNSTLGAWLTRDPIGYAATSPNLYDYGDSSPASIIDPLGLVGEIQGPIQMKVEAEGGAGGGPKSPIDSYRTEKMGGEFKMEMEMGGFPDARRRRRQKMEDAIKKKKDQREKEEEERKKEWEKTKQRIEDCPSLPPGMYRLPPIDNEIPSPSPNNSQPPPAAYPIV